MTDGRQNAEEQRPLSTLPVWKRVPTRFKRGCTRRAAFVKARLTCFVHGHVWEIRTHDNEMMKQVDKAICLRCKEYRWRGSNLSKFPDEEEIDDER